MSQNYSDGHILLGIDTRHNSQPAVIHKASTSNLYIIDRNVFLMFVIYVHTTRVVPIYIICILSNIIIAIS